MTRFKTLLTAFLTFIAFTIFAQIAKGNYNFDGRIGLTGDWQKSEFYRSIAATGLVSPSVGKFVTDKWFIGVVPELSAKIDRNDVDIFSTSPTKGQIFHYQTLGLGVNSRYYFAQAKNAHFFGLAGLSLSKNWSAVKDKVNNNNSSTWNATILNYTIGVGANIFLKPEVAFESILSFTHSDNRYAQIRINNQPSEVRRIQYDLFLLNFRLNNFINLSVPKEANDPSQYIKRGRQILGGQAYLNMFRQDGVTSTIYSFSPEFSEFITNNISVKGSIQAYGRISPLENIVFNTSAAVRYYFPISKRFFLYPELSAGYLTGNNSFFVINNPTFRTSIIKKVVFHYGISHQVNNFSSIII
jgi:hypothetical protein